MPPIRLKRIPKWTVVRIKWADAATFHDPSNSDDPDLYEPLVRFTVGHLLYWDKRKGITVAMEDDREAGMESDCQTVTVIPAGMILAVEAYESPQIMFSRSPKKKVSKALDKPTTDVV